MKNILFKLLIVFAFVSSITCCGLTKKRCENLSNNGQEYTGRVVMVYNMPITPYQLDSICVVDTLSKDLNDWLRTGYRDLETGSIIFKYTFIKRANTPGETVWIINEFPDSLSIMKRIKK